MMYLQNRIIDIDNLEKVGREIMNDNRYKSVKIAFALLRLDKIREIDTDNSNLEIESEKKEYYTFLYGLIVPEMKETESNAIEVKIDKDEFKIIKGKCKIQKIAQLLESLDQKKEANFNGYKIVYDPVINESKFYSSDDKRLRIEEKYPCGHLRLAFRKASVFPTNQ